MKNYTLCAFVALAFALCAEYTSAQLVYQPQNMWGQVPNDMLVARRLPGEIYTVMSYDFGGVPTNRRVFVYSGGGGPLAGSLFQNGDVLYEGILTWSGTDTIGLIGPSVPFGYSVGVQLVSVSTYEVVWQQVLFSQENPSAAPTLNYTGGYDIAVPINNYSTQVTIGSYVLTNGNYTKKLYCHLYDPNGSYSVVREFTVTGGVAPYAANFALPTGFQGQLCQKWSYRIRHNNNDPKFWVGEVTILEHEVCFWVGITTSTEDVGGAGENEGLALSAFPNPFTDQVTIVSPEATTYQVTSTSGQLVHTDWLVPGDNYLSFPGLAPGAYILRTENGQIVRIKKE